MKESGLMTCVRAMEWKLEVMVIFILGNGRMENCMGRPLLVWLMAIIMLDTLSMGNEKDLELRDSEVGRCMRDIGKRKPIMELEC